MDEGSFSLLVLSSSSSSLPSSPSSPSPSPSPSTTTEKQSADQKDDTFLQNNPEEKNEESGLSEHTGSVEECLLSGEENVTLISESMTVTSADQEKLLLLNKNTELRKVNNELMKLNEDWDQVYRNATLGLQQRVDSLEQENAAIKQLNNRLLLKVEHEQSAREYYEQTLMQELKKNQDLQGYIRTLESRIRYPNTHRNWIVEEKQASLGSVSFSSEAPGGPIVSPSHTSGLALPACLSSSFSPQAGPGGRAQPRVLGKKADPQHEVQDLKEQLEALRCQTQIYEAEYQTEHKDHKSTQQENRRLRRKREEMQLQLALLQEQLKVYEDDFRKERSDKQILQRLLMKKTPPVKDPVLVHRCNNEQKPQGGDNRTQTEVRVPKQLQRRQHHPLCPKHCDSTSQDIL